jgi:hypothetical protein
MAELNTYGDLKKVIKAISLKQKGEKIGDVALGVVMGMIPGAEAAKTTFDFIKAAFKKPDTKKTSTWLDKLDIDDKMSAIVDDTVENGFLKALAATIEREADDTPLEPDFNMNAKMVDFLKQKYGGRHIAGIKENQEMKTLKEHIKSLVREMLEEEGAIGNTTASVPGYLTPKAFSPKGQKKNAATKAAEKQGWKATKGETTMPSDSKVRDYKSLWPSAKKKGVKIYNERSNYDQASKYGSSSGYTATSGYTGPSLATKGGGYYTSAIKENNMNLNDIIDQELLNEVTYHKFKNEVKYRTKAEQLHKAIREVKRKLQEIDRIVEYTQRMKQELSEGDGIQYWNRTNKAVAAISEMVNHLNNKIKNLNQ